MASISPEPRAVMSGEMRQNGARGHPRRTALLLIWFLFGPVGGHRFHQGKNGLGLVLLVAAIWTLILSWTPMAGPVCIAFITLMLLDFGHFCLNLAFDQPPECTHPIQRFC